MNTMPMAEARFSTIHAVTFRLALDKPIFEKVAVDRTGNKRYLRGRRPRKTTFTIAEVHSHITVPVSLLVGEIPLP